MPQALNTSPSRPPQVPRGPLLQGWSDLSTVLWRDRSPATSPAPLARRLAMCMTSLFLALLCTDALAQTQIWRCGPDGRSFSDRPCADGRLQTLAPAPDAERVQQARSVAEREAALAQALRSERLAQEAARRAQQQAEERERRLAQREAARQEARARAQARLDERAQDRREAGEAGGVTLSPSRQTRQALSAAPAPRTRPAGAGTSAPAAHASR